MSHVTLDHVEGFRLDEEGIQKYFNELKTLEYLSQGLAYLNAQVCGIEEEVRNKAAKQTVLFAFGNAPQLRGVPQGLVACSFHWYAVSACNFVRLLGWIGHREDHAQAKEYVSSVMPEVERWRNKVAAHFALLDPRNEDSPADLAASVWFPIGFNDGAFWTQPLTMVTSKAGEANSSRRDMRWSLSDTHRKLSGRYWPGSRPTQKESEAIKNA